MVTTPVSMRRAIRTLTDKTDLALACVNDDQPDSPATDSVRSQFQRWMQSAFGRDSPFVQWEKPNVPWDTEFKGL
jgi:hypothetical protein